MDTKNTIYNAAIYSELKTFYEDENATKFYKVLIDKCFKCILGISFEEFIISEFNSIEKELEEKNELIIHLKSDIKELRENYINLHQKMIQGRK